jgi:hypothetical protein
MKLYAQEAFQHTTKRKKDTKYESQKRKTSTTQQLALSFVNFVLLCCEIVAACANDLRSEDNRNPTFSPLRGKGAKL